ncbi:hypothetical protein NMY22_g18209 [Coprinellus aureogranulatus]|nr:hypothetical protein NMY22_g18209 [Coprinellus aureogranulatus]
MDTSPPRRTLKISLIVFPLYSEEATLSQLCLPIARLGPDVSSQMYCEETRRREEIVPAPLSVQPSIARFLEFRSPCSVPEPTLTASMVYTKWKTQQPLHIQSNFQNQISYPIHPSPPSPALWL